MDFKRFKLAVFDLDGTLVEYGTDRISPATLETINLLLEKGIRTTIATGRSWKKTRTIVDQLKVKAPVLVQSGAIIVEPGTEKVLKLEPLRDDIEGKLHGIIDDSLVDQFRLSETGAYFAAKVSTSGGTWLLNNSEDCRITSLDQDHYSTVKHLFIGPEAELRLLSEKVGKFKPTPNTILWPPDQLTEDWFLEVFDPSATKGQALSWLAEYLGLTLNEIIAFGDGYNDLDLLQTAGFGVAMHGAPQELIDQADLVIPGAAEEGIARLFRGEPVGVKVKVS